MPSPNVGEKPKRSHKRIDPAFKALKQAALALQDCPEYMRRPTLEFLCDKFLGVRLRG